MEVAARRALSRGLSGYVPVATSSRAAVASLPVRWASQPQSSPAKRHRAAASFERAALTASSSSSSQLPAAFESLPSKASQAWSRTASLLDMAQEAYRTRNSVIGAAEATEGTEEWVNLDSTKRKRKKKIKKHKFKKRRKEQRAMRQRLGK